MHPNQLTAKSTVGEERLATRSRKCCKAFTIDNFRTGSIIYMQAETCQNIRAYLLMTDCDPGEVKTNMPVEMILGKLYEGARMYCYFWKCRPIR